MHSSMGLGILGAAGLALALHRMFARRKVGSSDGSLRLLLVGFGSAGKQLAHIVANEKHRFPGLSQLRVLVVGITTGSRGCLVNTHGIDLRRAIREAEAGAFTAANPDLYSVHCESIELARQLDYDVLVELSPLSITAQGEPAISHCATALGRGRHVVSGNKGPLAFAHRRMARLAKSNGCRFLYESCVMDGAPIFNLVQHSMKGCTVTQFSGILNSTCNFILSEMEKGMSMADAVRVAQERGFAEADSSHDTQGWDAACKVAVLSNTLLDADITPAHITRMDLAKVTPAEAQEAVRQGFRLKQVSRAVKRADGTVEASVSIERLPMLHAMAAVSGSGSCLCVHTDLMTPITITQEEPDLYDTAYGVINDLLCIAMAPT